MLKLAQSVACLFFLFIALQVQAQNSINASEVLALLDAGKEVSIENTTIQGDLNFTQLANKEKDTRERWGGNENYLAHVRNTVSFRNCTFTGKVLGYYRIEGQRRRDKDQLFNVDFHEAVTFQNCKFNKEVNFKYTEFVQGASFAQSAFRQEALFKYTEFAATTDFSDVTIGGASTFKYTEFPAGVTFANTTFGGNAIFKYTQFPAGVNFSSAKFQQKADFKYTEFSTPSNFDDTDFGRYVDFKYTTLDGNKFAGN